MSPTISGVERLARADRRHAATTDEWDADPWLLNTPGGVAVSSNGTVFVADVGNRLIRAVTPAGAVTRLAGGGSTDFDMLSI